MDGPLGECVKKRMHLVDGYTTTLFKRQNKKYSPLIHTILDNSNFIYIVCYDRGFRRKPRPVNSVSYLILTRV